MEAIKIAFLFYLFISLSVAIRVNLETRPQVPSHWVQKEAVEDNQPIKLYFALKQQNIAELEKVLLQVSDPTHPKYGKHLSLDDVNKLVAPSRESFDAVLNWIRSEAGSNAKIEIFNDFVTATMSSVSASNMVGCKFHRFHHKTDQKHKLARCAEGSYTVPSNVAPHLDFVGGTVHFPKIPKPQIITDEPGIGVTPRIIRDRYKVGDASGKASNNKQAVAQFLNQFYDEIDLQEFFTLFYWPAIGNSVEKVVGTNYAYEPGTEASLDIQYIMAVGSDIPTWFYSTLGEHEGQEPFLEWALLVGNTSDSDVPKVISVSYGDEEDSLDINYAQRVNQEFMKLGARGISILFASGDSGVGCNNAGTLFVPNFPASSPWVTAVGGTTTEELFELGDEIVNGLSGGGFSNFFSAPSYQKNAIAQYLATASGLPAPSFYNKTGRAYPDVSALSSAFTIVIYGIPTPGVSGTSCAAPTFSGVVALLNDLRLQNNKAPLGFLNPFLYQTSLNRPEAFFDVTEGCNPGGCPNDGFCAAKGWDPASGLGTPVYDKLAQIVLQLP